MRREFIILNGLVAGNYILYSKSADNKMPRLKKSAKLKLSIGKTYCFQQKIKTQTKQLLTCNSLALTDKLQILAVPLNSGKTYTVYVAGKNLDAKNLTATVNFTFYKSKSEKLQRTRLRNGNFSYQF